MSSIQVGYTISRDRPRIPLPSGIVERFPDAQHARWGLGASPFLIPSIDVQRIANPSGLRSVAAITHPIYELSIRNWFKWRLTYEGGERFVEEYIRQFSKRESYEDFRRRKDMTPIPAFAKAAINEIKNSIFQRTADITRKGGPSSYEKAMAGQVGGVDLKACTMNWFVGHYILPELLTMGKVGVYVDNQPTAPNLALQQGRHPYLYTYRAEDIRSWAYAPVNEAGTTEFTSVLLREYGYIYDEQTGLPRGEVEKYRHIFIGKDGFVHICFYDQTGNIDPIFPEQILTITKIPFVIFELSDSLLKDVAPSQIALTNMESSDVSYALKGNFPFYVEQFNTKDNTPIIRAAQASYRELVSGSISNDLIEGELPFTQVVPESAQESTQVGVSQGRRYPLGTDQPAFINPSPEPLEVSMAKQKALKEDIRQLVHLALSTIQPKMASAESKGIDQQGLESGLSYIGLELERGERVIATYWSMYENSLDIPTVIYPKQWSLKSVSEVQAEVTQLQNVRDDLPSKTFKTQINIKIAHLIVGASVTSSIMDTIEKELQNAKGASSNPKTIIGDVEAGVLGLETAVGLRGYPDDEATKAANDHAERLARITAVQSSGEGLIRAARTDAETELNQLPSALPNPAARGLPDLSANPSQESALEKKGKKGRGNAN